MRTDFEEGMMDQSLCIERVTHYVRGDRRARFCRESRKRCRGYKAFFCVAWDLAKFIMASVLGMFLMMEGE
jgi:hypothetical protein